MSKTRSDRVHDAVDDFHASKHFMALDDANEHGKCLACVCINKMPFSLVLPMRILCTNSIVVEASDNAADEAVLALRGIEETSSDDDPDAETSVQIKAGWGSKKSTLYGADNTELEVSRPALHASKVCSAKLE